MTEVIHRGDTGRAYNGIPMHAAPGVHEFAERLVSGRVPKGVRILDVGSGSGALAQRLHDAGFDVLGSDLDISDYKAETKAVQWNASGADLPEGAAPGEFDCVCAVEILEHVENPMQALRNFRALLRPGGLLVLSTPNIGHPRSRLKFFLTGEPSYFGRAEYYSSGHRCLLPDWMVELHLKEAGFERAKLAYAGSLGLGGTQKLVYGALQPAFRALRMLPSPRSGDGCVTFATAYRGVAVSE